jgi:thiamine transport system permease protein
MPRLPRSSNSPTSRPPRPFRLIAGAGVALAILAVITLVFWSILTEAAPAGTSSRVDILRLVVMTTTQAGLTTLLSLGVGTALAWALNRLDFPLRPLVIGLFSAAIVTPGLVVAFGLIAVWGRAGWASSLWSSLTGGPLDLPLFGLFGILLAHVVLDASFAARILLARLETIPAARLKTGQSLGLTALQRFRLIDWPAIRPSLPGLGAIIFLLAFTSFPIVLMLGGGPANQTLEVAIYSAVRLDFDLLGAVRLALVQVALCALVLGLAAGFAPVPSRLTGSAVPLWRERGPARLAAVAVLILGIVGFGLPLLAVLIDGLGAALPPLLSRASFWQSLVTSLLIGVCASSLSLVLAFAVAAARSATQSSAARVGLGLSANAYLAVPSVVLALGFFLLVRGFGIPPGALALPVVILANSLLALPFALATLAPPLEAIATTRGKLIRALGLGGLRQFTAVEWPLLARDIGVVLALGFCFSLGDLGVISLFGTEEITTLPMLMYRSLGAYRSADAGAIAALMLLLSVAAFTLLPLLFERLGHACSR